MFALRTWWYSGVFSLLYGTSLKNNDTGLRWWTVGSVAVWKRIAHSVSALVWMNEPPVRSRAFLIVGGMLLSMLALLQVPRAVRLPASIAIVTRRCGGQRVHRAHPRYPGRMSIHLVPFAVAMSSWRSGRWIAASTRGDSARRQRRTRMTIAGNAVVLLAMFTGALGIIAWASPAPDRVTDRGLSRSDRSADHRAGLFGPAVLSRARALGAWPSAGSVGGAVEGVCHARQRCRRRRCVAAVSDTGTSTRAALMAGAISGFGFGSCTRFTTRSRPIR